MILMSSKLGVFVCAFKLFSIPKTVYFRVLFFSLALDSTYSFPEGCKSNHLKFFLTKTEFFYDIRKYLVLAHFFVFC